MFIPEAVRSAVDHLDLLGAAEKKEGHVFLTALGKKMASFPLEPRYAKVKSTVQKKIMWWVQRFYRIA